MDHWWYAFMQELRIPPWDLGRLTVVQFRQAIEEFKRLQKEREAH